ncbi:MAG: metalloregulator ArsR/SmtB family transcription factor [Gammaproteobacteria bacterium]|nr:metalloregulator ArsR/SmtB family transcription factor [Gammaproteobacteria bacterium]
MNPADMASHADAAESLLKAMANRHRLMILCYLVAGERSVGELNRDIALSQSSLSQHLARLRDDGLVKTRRDGQTIHYSICAGPATRVMETLHEAFCASADDSTAGAAKGATT